MVQIKELVVEAAQENVMDVLVVVLMINALKDAMVDVRKDAA